MIKINNLLKIFNKNKRNEVRAIDDVSLEFPQKGLVAIYGASGSGKTTLMNALGGLDKFDGGEIIMDGNVYKKVVGDKYRINNIGYIFQNYLLDDKLDVYQNVAQGLRTEGVRDEEIIFKRVMTALDNVGMRDYFKRDISTLSGGQQQRVAIARAMVKGAKIILADEPTGNLDENNTKKVMDLLKAMSQNCLVIVVTHESDLIEKYADSVIEIKDGKVNTLSEGNRISHNALDKSAIFLGDKQKSKITSDYVNIDYYGEPANIKLTIVNENGKLYLKAIDSNLIMLDENAETKFIDKTQEEYIAEQRVKTSCAIEELGEIRGKKTGSVFSFRRSFVSGLKSFFGKKRKGFTLATIAVFVMLLASVIITGIFGASYYNYKTVGEYIHTDLVVVPVESGDEYNQVMDYIESKNYKVEYDYIWNSINSFHIYVDGFQSFTDLNASYSNFILNDIEDTKDMKWIYRNPDNITSYNQIVISSALADDILDKGEISSNINDVGYDLLYNASVFLINEKTKIAGIVKEDDYRVYINDLFCLEIIFNYTPDICYGVEVKDGEMFVPSYYGYEYGETRDIYGKTFKLVPSDKVESNTINAKELRDIKQRFTYYLDLCIVSPQADELGKDLLASGIVTNVSSRAIDNEEIIAREYNSMKTRAIICAVLIAILVIFAFLMFCASLSSKLKEIGLYRAIGVSAKNIVYKFFVESLAFITISLIAVYLVVGLPILIFSNGLLIYMPLWLYFGSFAILFASMMIVSVLPILLHIRKTPVQILSKYDM